MEMHDRALNEGIQETVDTRRYHNNHLKFTATLSVLILAPAVLIGFYTPKELAVWLIAVLAVLACFPWVLHYLTAHQAVDQAIDRFRVQSLQTPTQNLALVYPAAADRGNGFQRKIARKAEALSGMKCYKVALNYFGVEDHNQAYVTMYFH